MLSLMLILAGQAALAHPAEAELLGRRLSTISGMATIAPRMIE